MGAATSLTRGVKGALHARIQARDSVPGGQRPKHCGSSARTGRGQPDAVQLNQGRFAWPREVSGAAASVTLTQPQVDALVLGLPWQRLEQTQVITRM